MPLEMCIKGRASPWETRLYRKCALKEQKTFYISRHIIRSVIILLPLPGEFLMPLVPRMLPRAMVLLGLQPAICTVFCVMCLKGRMPDLGYEPMQFQVAYPCI